MSTNVLIIGQSGTGKSTSIKTLDPAETFIINVVNKPLPFKGWRAKYIPISKDGASGNIFTTDNAAAIIRTMAYISTDRPEIKTVVIDDWQYVMANEFMRRANEIGFAKFTSIGQNAWSIITDSQRHREDLVVVFLSHSEETDSGIIKCKTIGKMIDEKITLEGLFTVVLKTEVKEGRYYFTTKNSGRDTVKAPDEMFETDLIDNNLALVCDAIRAY